MIKNLDLSVIKTLISYIKLPMGTLNKMSHLNGMIEQEDAEIKKWAYFGEFLEREPGYITEKAIAYCYVFPFLTPVDINDYQVKDFIKVLQEYTEANCYTKLALAYFLEDTTIFTDLEIMAEDFCYLREIISTRHHYEYRANYETLMQNLIKNSKTNWFNVGGMSVREVSDLIWSINCSNEFLGTKLAKAFAKLESGKAPDSTLNTLIKELNISYLDAMCLNFFCLERAGSDRAVTNSIMNTLKSLFEVDEEWSLIQKATFDKIAHYNKLPNKVFGNDLLKDAMRCQDIYPQKIKFENLIYALNNENFENLVNFFSVDLFKLSADKVDILLGTKYLLRKSTFVYLITENMNRYMKEPEKIDTLSKLYENRYESIYNLLSSDYSIFCNFIAQEYVDLIKDIDRLDTYNLKRYLTTCTGINVYKIFKHWFNNGQYKRIIEIVREKTITSAMAVKVWLNCEDVKVNREYVDIIANVLAMSETNTHFAYFIYNILNFKEESLKYYSEEELHSMYSSMKNILASFPEPRYWGTLGPNSIRALDNLYMSEEDKERRKQEEEEAKKKEQLAAFHKYLDEQLERAGDKLDKFNAYWSYHIPKFGDKLEYGSLILEKFFPEPEIIISNRGSVDNIMEGLGEMFKSKLITLQTLKNTVNRITIKEGGNTNE